MIERGLGFHFFLDLCPSDAADTGIVDEAVQAGEGYEGVGVDKIASAGVVHVHAARGLMQPDTRNTAADG